MADDNDRPDAEADETASEPERKRLRDLTKDDVVEALDKRQHRWTDRKRLTGDEVEEMMRSRSAERKRLRSERKARGEPPRLFGKQLSSIAGVVLLLGAAGMAAGTMSIDNSAAEYAATSSDRISSLEGQVRDAQPQDEADVEKRREEVKDGLSQAREDAGVVADLQNEFQSILVKTNKEKDPGDGTPKSSFIKAAKHREKLADHFAENSWLVTDDEIAYNAGSDIPFDDDEIDPRFQWYTLYANKNHTSYAKPSQSSWKLVSTVPSRLAEPGQVTVTWLNHNDDGRLLAWARATYIVEDETFTDLDVGTTTLGDRYGLPKEGEN